MQYTVGLKMTVIVLLEADSEEEAKQQALCAEEDWGEMFAHVEPEVTFVEESD